MRFIKLCQKTYMHTNTHTEGKKTQNQKLNHRNSKYWITTSGTKALLISATYKN